MYKRLCFHVLEKDARSFTTALIIHYKRDILCPLPEYGVSEGFELFVSVDDAQKVVACELTHLAGEERVAIGEEDLSFAETTWIEQELTGGWMTGVILEANPHLKLSKRNPGGFATPACLDNFVMEGE